MAHSGKQPAVETGSSAAYRCEVSPIWNIRKSTWPGMRSSVTSVVTEEVGSGDGDRAELFEAHHGKPELVVSLE